MINILYDPVLQTFVFSPLMGVLFATIFSGTAKRPSSRAPRTVVQTREVYVERSIDRRPRNQGDGKEIVGLAFLLVLVLWKYVQVAPLVHSYIAIGLSVAISFCVTSFLISFYKGQFTDPSWITRIVVPIIALTLCVYLLQLASKGLSPSLIDQARATNAIQFYFHVLDDSSRNELITHVLGVFGLVVLALISWLTLIHFLALMNQREGSYFHGFWCWLTNLTFRFSSTAVSVLLGVIAIVSLLLINGTIAGWMGDG